MDVSEEIKLIEAAKEDIAAFEKLYKYYLPHIYNYIYSRTYNKETAEDLTSQVFLLFVEKVKTFNLREGARLGSWLYRVANSKIIDAYRKKKMSDLSDFEEALAKNDDTEKNLSNEFNRAQIVVVLKTINPRYQEVIALSFFSELEHKEIAEVMKMRAEQVKVLLHRALQVFKKEFKKSFPKSETFDDY
jgi:RNA polymerase sigma-70 factor (ECF subfamily)